jgi:aldehyde dehydrogenase (NAD+)
VVAAILVWNGPLMTAAMKSAPAIAAGNTVVLKAPELAPFAVMRFAELCAEAGLPPGVINVITGGPDAGQALVAHPGVDKVSFTGSMAVARQVLKTAADHITPVVMELGGKSANIVFEDARLEPATVLSALFCKNAGQGCNLPTRLLVQDSIYDEFMGLAVDVVSRIVVGNALQPGVGMGPVVSAAARDRVIGVIEAACSHGSAKLLAGGEQLGGDLAAGYFIAPTVFSEVDNRSRLAQEEIFGPVVAAMRFVDEREAVAMANDSAYGLAAYLSTRDVGRAHRVADQLEAGYVAVNGANPMPASSPYGGFRGSGYGKEGGRQGIEEFLRPKTVYIAID